MPELVSSDLASAIGAGHAGPPAHASSLAADSRVVRRGVAFAAVNTGVKFIADAVARGAPFVVVDDASVVPDGASAIVAADVTRALGAIAKHVRGGSSYDVVGITGSTGKTLTKDFVAAALSTALRVHSAPSSYNNEIGVPLVLLDCPDTTEVVVAELGARGVGQIAELCDIVRPRIGAITAVGNTHLELFRTRDAIARTKSELLASIPGDGLAVVPSNDDFLHVFTSSTNARIATVGPGARVSYRADRIGPDGRTSGRVSVDGETIDVVLPVPGRPLMRNAAFAIRIAMELGVTARAAARALADAPLSSWRLEIADIEGRTVINDAYNANPTSVAAALRSARELAGGRELWAVLGHMAELGPASDAEHRRIGRLAVRLGFAGVVVVGEEAAGIAEGAGTVAQPVSSVPEAAAVARERIPAGAVVVVKASRVAGLERLVELLGGRSFVT